MQPIGRDLINMQLSPFNVMFRENNAIWAYTLVVATVAGQRQYQLPNDSFLKDKPIVGLFTRCTTSGTTRYSFNGNTLVNKAVVSNTFISLFLQNLSFQQQVPLELYLRNWADTSLVTGSSFQPLIFPSGIVLENCYLNISQGLDSSNWSANQNFELTFIYTDPKQCGVFSQI